MGASEATEVEGEVTYRVDDTVFSMMFLLIRLILLFWQGNGGGGEGKCGGDEDAQEVGGEEGQKDGGLVAHVTTGVGGGRDAEGGDMICAINGHMLKDPVRRKDEFL